MPNRRLYYIVGMTLGGVVFVFLATFNMFLLHGREIVISHLILPFVMGVFVGFLISNSILYYKTLKKLQQNELLLQQYKDAVDSCLIVSKADLKGRITYANRQFEALSGYTQEELLGQLHNIVRHPSVPKDTYKTMWDTITAKSIWRGLLLNRAKDGSSYSVSATVIPLLDTKGKIYEYLSLRTDVTELERLRVHTQKALEDTNRHLNRSERELLEHQKILDIAAVYSRMDLNGHFTQANENFLKLLGYESEELLGVHCHAFAVSIRDEIFDKVLLHMKQEGLYKGVVNIRTKEGISKIFEVEFIPISDESGEMVEIMNFYHDLTDFYALHDEIEKTQKEVIFTIGSVVESRSKETANHVVRVAEISKLLALEYGLNEATSELIKHACPMHDIGKIAIEDAILTKPAALTPEEFSVMKTHVQIGYDILKGSKRALLQTAAIIAYEHHEKFDGSGYPRGLKGEDIHIYGRIVAVADVFDALISKRYYKEPWPLERVVEYFKENINRHFDGVLVNLLLKNIEAVMRIQKQYQDPA